MSAADPSAAALPARVAWPRRVLLCLALLVVLGEAALRIAGRTDENGQFWLARKRVRPYVLPVAGVRRALQETSGISATYLAADAELGWTIRPGASSRDGLFHANEQGLRADRSYAAEPEPGVRRVAAFGDSFTHGDEVALEDTWVARLETDPSSATGNARLETLNFGVPGYGLDQAWLRWRALGPEYSPQVVVLGFVAEDVYRLVNVMRPLYQPTVTIPFSKPRFVLAPGPAPLRLVNNPTLAPDRLPDELEDFGRSSLASYEAYFDARDYRAAWWQRSRLLAWLSDLPRTDPIAHDPTDAPRFLAPLAEAGRLALAIVDGFRAEVEARGARFVLLHMPRRSDLAAWREHEPLPYADLLAELGRRAELIDTAPALAAQPAEELYQQQGHFRPAGHAIIAGVLRPALLRSAPVTAPDRGSPSR